MLTGLAGDPYVVIMFYRRNKDGPGAKTSDLRFIFRTHVGRGVGRIGECRQRAGCRARREGVRQVQGMPPDWRGRQERGRPRVEWYRGPQGRQLSRLLL